MLAPTLLLERLHEFNLRLWAVSLDLSKSFERVNWNKLWKALKSRHLPQYLIDALRAIYSDQLGVVRGSNNNVSHHFAIKRGVKQGCPLSPGLFNAVLQLVIQKWQDQIRQLGIGLNIHDQHLSNPRIADDMLLLATFQDDTICMLEI